MSEFFFFSLPGWELGWVWKNLHEFPFMHARCTTSTTTSSQGLCLTGEGGNGNFLSFKYFSTSSEKVKCKQIIFLNLFCTLILNSHVNPINCLSDLKLSPSDLASAFYKAQNLNNLCIEYSYRCFKINCILYASVYVKFSSSLTTYTFFLFRAKQWNSFFLRALSTLSWLMTIEVGNYFLV